MFQTEPILLLQSLASEWLTALMTGVTRAAYPDVLAALVIGVAFGLNLRAGLVLAQAVLWTELLTGFLKGIVALPRPSDVDSRVALIAGDATNDTPFIAAGGAGVFDLPAAEVIRAVRLREAASFGFPSSAVSTTAAFWGGAALVFRSSRLLGIAAAVVTLMALSRLYLGRHFVADVAGGILVGAAVLGALSRSVLSPPKPLSAPGRHAVLAVLPLAALLILPHIDPASAGSLGGLYLATLLLEPRGLPTDAAPPASRVARFALAAALYAGTAALVGFGLRSGGIDEDGRWATYVRGGLMVFVVFWGGVRLSERIGLYRRAA